MEKSVHAEVLFQTTEQRESGNVTYRIFLDGAYRNVEGEVSWKKLSNQELVRQLEQVYFTERSGRVS